MGKSGADLGPIVVANMQKMKAADVLTIVKKSNILEITGLTIKEQIMREIATFFILTMLLLFLAAGFLAIATPSQFISSISTAIAMAIGGGANLPLQKDSAAKAAEQKVWLNR